jgi:hypothetical protein
VKVPAAFPHVAQRESFAVEVAMCYSVTRKVKKANQDKTKEEICERAKKRNEISSCAFDCMKYEKKTPMHYLFFFLLPTVSDTVKIGINIATFYILFYSFIQT